jgi:hypothetical protein
MPEKIGFIKYGSEYMDLYSDMTIGRPTIKMKPSSDWKVLGAIRFNNFGHQIEEKQFEQLHELNNDWFYKNGKQKWHVIDYDHGTMRTWMCPNHLIHINKGN